VADCRAELGRASWKLFHTIMGRYPEKPTLDEREALKSYIHLFARLYPCGEWYADVWKSVDCSAEHFQTLLISHPPQTSSREAASQWGCHIHNKVNESLNKVSPVKAPLTFRKSSIAPPLAKYTCAAVMMKRTVNQPIQNPIQQYPPQIPIPGTPQATQTGSPTSHWSLM
jgi:hypothetical protein